MYGCGSTKHGQLPSLRFGNGQPGVEIDEDGMGSPHSDDSQGGEQQQPRNEMTVPTKLRLPFMQPGRPGGSKTPIVCAVMAGSNASAFLTRAQSEFPETSHVPLWTRYPLPPPIFPNPSGRLLQACLSVWWKACGSTSWLECRSESTCT